MRGAHRLELMAPWAVESLTTILDACRLMVVFLHIDIYKPDVGCTAYAAAT